MVAAVSVLSSAAHAQSQAAIERAGAIEPGVDTGARVLDLSPVPATDERGKWWSLGGLAGVFTGLTAYTYFAWYHDKPQLPEFTVNGDGWFGPDTYAGGADKLGHLWGNLVISRGTTEILLRGGWSPLQASLLGSGLTLAFFTYVELKDGFYYQFSTGDMVGNAIGAGLSAVMVNYPQVDDLLDFRVEYTPTDEYIDLLVDDGDINVLEDYSGQTYYLAFHVSGIPGLSERPWLRWGRYLDVVAGFEARNYKPEPQDPAAARRQSLFLGVSVNMQQLLGELFAGTRSRVGRATHTAGDVLFEYVHVPYTTLRVADAVRSPDAP